MSPRPETADLARRIDEAAARNGTPPDDLATMAMYLLARDRLWGAFPAWVRPRNRVGDISIVLRRGRE